MGAPWVIRISGGITAVRAARGAYLNPRLSQPGSGSSRSESMKNERASTVTRARPRAAITGSIQAWFIASVASPIICRSALAIEAHRGVASLANTARYGLRDAPWAALRWLRAAYVI